MDTFAGYMMSIYVQYNLVLAVIMVVVGIWIAKRLPSGWTASIIGFFASILAAVTIVSIAIVVMVMVATGGAAIIAALPVVAWALETGPEFALIPMFLCPTAFVIGRVRRKRTVSLPASS
ncbi:hypothetical protein NKH91_29605 [Mesorhizobium sp. M0894]|uniref:hypothetical protein n=1 Tax=unclassified Mesorhizobium TaxID=325217 RepID=UPI003335390B